MACLARIVTASIPETNTATQSPSYILTPTPIPLEAEGSLGIHQLEKELKLKGMSQTTIACVLQLSVRIISKRKIRGKEVALFQSPIQLQNPVLSHSVLPNFYAGFWKCK